MLNLINKIRVKPVMEEFLFVLHKVYAREFDLDIALQFVAAVQLDGDVFVFFF